MIDEIDENLKGDEREPMVERDDGKELTIEVSAPARPSGKMKFASTTLSPASLKLMKNVFEKDTAMSGKST